MKPLREAARRLGVSEEALRRKILLGEVDATPVDDDRQYLVAVPARPSRRGAPCRLFLWSVVAWAVLGTCLVLGTSRTGQSCVRCGSWKETERLFGVPMSSVTVEAREGGGACAHDWRRYGPK